MLKRMGMRRGVNLGGWLSQCDYSQERLNGFIREEDFAQIAAWGLDHVRIPVDYNVLEDGRGGYDGAGFERIGWALACCKRHGLKAVIDLHKTAGFSFDEGEHEAGFFDDAAYQERFYRLWEAMARRWGHLSDLVVFELLNEVTKSAYIDQWNRISHEAIRRIRVYAPNVLILVGSYHHNSVHAVKDLAAPADDRVIYNFHCYEPLAYTHQCAPWVKILEPGKRIPFEESGASEEAFEAMFAPAIEAAQRNHTTLYCGEYGVIDQVEPEDAIKWFRTINAVFEKYDIPRSVWSYRRMDFGVSDPYWDALRPELLKVL